MRPHEYELLTVTISDTTDLVDLHYMNTALQIEALQEGHVHVEA
jgi:hypothetical protein